MKSFNWIIPAIDRKQCSKQIEEFIIINIKSKNLRPGDALPGYRTLAKLNGVALNSVRRAYGRLIETAWLDTQNGTGTFVANKVSTSPLTAESHGFIEEFPLSLNLAPLEESVPSLLLPFTFVGTDFPNPALFPEERLFKYRNRHRIDSAKYSQSKLLTAYAGEYLKEAVVADLNRYRGFDLEGQMLQVINGREDSLRKIFRLLVKPGELVINTALYDPVLNGDLEEYRRNARQEARKNRDVLDMILQNYLQAFLSYNLPEHGLTFWIHFDDRFDLNALLKEMEVLGIPVPYHPSNQPIQGKLNDMVLGFGAFDIAEAEGGAKMLSEIFKQRLGGL